MSAREFVRSDLLDKYSNRTDLFWRNRPGDSCSRACFALYKALSQSLLVIWTTFRKTSIWGFKSSLIVAALLGALSVNYLDCSGEYEYLKESGYLVLAKGLEQIGTALVLLSITTGAWLLVFIIRMLVNRRPKSEKQS